MNYFILFLYNFYKYAVISVFGLLAIILTMYNITFMNLLFWIIMLFMSLVQFFAYCNGIKAQLEKQFIESYNKSVVDSLEKIQQEKINKFKNN